MNNEEPESFAEELFGSSIGVRRKEVSPTVFSKLYSNPIIPDSHPLDEEQVTKYISACDPSIQSIVREFFNNTTHVSYDRLKTVLFACFDEFFQFVAKRKISKIYIYIPKIHHNLEKSNFWITQHFTTYCFDKHIDMTNIHFVTSRAKMKLCDNEVCMILDDASYSGSQIYDNLASVYSHEDEDFVFKSKPMSATESRSSRSNRSSSPLRSYIYLMIPYMTKKAIDKVKTQLRSYRTEYQGKLHIRLIIPKNTVVMKTLENLMSLQNIKKMFAFMGLDLTKEYNWNRGSEKSCPLYFDHKLPDSWSSFPDVYNGLVLNENAGYGRKHDYIPVIAHCKGMTKFSYTEPLCPFPPYKNDYKRNRAVYMKSQLSSK